MLVETKNIFYALCEVYVLTKNQNVPLLIFTIRKASYDVSFDMLQNMQ